MAQLLYKDEVYAIVGAAMEVYYQLGTGFNEAVYQDAMEIELNLRKIPQNAQQDIFVFYKGQRLKNFFKPDLICFENVVVELKALDRLTSREESQVLNYLKATGLPVALLINFGGSQDLEWKRIVLTQKPAQVRRSVALQPSSGVNFPEPIEND